MNTSERRKEILRILQGTEIPVAARELAAKFGVSRQVIVQDMAVIRASNRASFPLQRDMPSSRTPVLPENLRYVTDRSRQQKN